MKHITRRSIIAGTVLAVFSGSASYAQELPGVRTGWVKNGKWTATPSDPGGQVISTATPTPTLPPGEWTATPTNTASATSTLTRTPAPTKTPVPPTATSGVQPSPTTPYSQPNPEAAATFDYTAERFQTIDRINEERAKVGVARLVPDALVMDVAQLKANDHRDRGYTGHEAPGGACFYGTCFSQPFSVWHILDAAGYRWASVAENYWLGGSYTTEMDAVNVMVFMGSESHRHAILDPVFTHAGIGIAFDPRWNGAHVIQVFTKPAESATFSTTELQSLTRSSDGRLSQARARRR
jgi:uncharacterized protein YkwD